jgi:hypothetical protein
MKKRQFFAGLLKYIFAKMRRYVRHTGVLIPKAAEQPSIRLRKSDVGRAMRRTDPLALSPGPAGCRSSLDAAPPIDAPERAVVGSAARKLGADVAQR